MLRSLDRGAYVLILLVVVGVLAAIVVPFCVLDGDGDDGPQVSATATADATADEPDGTPTEPPATATPGDTPTATPEGFTDPDAALNAFVRDEFDADFIGDCPLTAVPDGETGQICGTELYRSEELVTFTLGVPFSEGIGEAVIAIDAAGFWTVTFVPVQPLGEAGIAVGDTAVVFGAGSCLNFRDEPSLDADVAFCVIDGTSDRVIEGPVEAGGVTWWRIQGLGWASEEFLIPLVD